MTYYDITMGNNAINVHFYVTISNDVAMCTSHDITMHNDVAMCTSHDITMHNDVAMSLFYYALLHPILISLFPPINVLKLCVKH